MGDGVRSLGARRHPHTARHVGDHGEGQHPHAARAKREHFGYDRHPDHVPAHPFDHADLGRSLEAGTEQGGVRAARKTDAQSGSLRERRLLQPRVVRGAHVREGGCLPRLGGRRQRRAREQVDMVVDQHQATRPQARVDPPHRGGDDGTPRSQRRRDAGRRGDHPRRMALVEVQPPALHDDRHPLAAPEEEMARMPRDPRGWKPGNLPELHFLLDVDQPFEPAQPRTEQQMHLRSRADSRPHRHRHRFEVVSRPHTRLHRIIPATVAVMKAASVPPTIARNPMRERSCRREGASPPMPPSWMAMEEKLAKPHRA